MKYELALKLKNAGFPRSSSWVDEGDKFQDDVGYAGREVPTLSELIEACQGSIHVLRFPLSLEKQIGIKVMAESSIFVNSNEEECIKGFGETPAEAVANLWLALNKK